MTLENHRPAMTEFSEIWPQAGHRLGSPGPTVSRPISTAIAATLNRIGAGCDTELHLCITTLLHTSIGSKIHTAWLKVQNKSSNARRHDRWHFGIDRYLARPLEANNKDLWPL
eukprot:scaffold510655_cov19-Prasinocladus_malaysianus.AAC.1